MVDGLLAPFGDKVVVVYGTNYGQMIPFRAPRRGPVPPIARRADRPVSRPPLRFGDHVSLPRASRCIKGKTLGVKAHNAAVTIRAGTRTATAQPGRRVALRLKQRKTKVHVTVTHADGRTATQAFTYRRC